MSNFFFLWYLVNIMIKKNWCKVLCVIEPSMIGFIKIRDYTRQDPYKGPWKAIKHLALGFTYHEMNETLFKEKKFQGFFSSYLKTCLCMKDLFFIWRILLLITYRSLAIWIEKLSCFYPWVYLWLFTHTGFINCPNRTWV